MGSFWKGAFATKKQKLFWVIFSIIVAIIVVVIIGALLPRTAHEETRLKSREWAHIYPDSFWHEDAVYKVTTVPADGGKGKELDNVDAHVLDMGVNGKNLDFALNADSVNLLIGNPVGVQNWNASVYMTLTSTATVTVETTSVAMDFLAATDKDVFEQFLKDGSVKDKSAVLEHLQGVQQISSTIEINGVDKYLYSQRVYIGLKESSGNDKVLRSEMMYYRHIAEVPLENCTNFTNGVATLPFNSLSLIQVNAPEECSSDSVTECIVEVTLRPRWTLFFCIVVLPTIVVGTGVTIGLMALKAWHTQQTIAYMRKKAKEEGVALEEGKSKDIHEEKVKEGEEEGEHPEGEPAIEEEHPEGEEGEEGEKAEKAEETKAEEETTDGAILTAGPESKE